MEQGASAGSTLVRQSSFERKLEAFYSNVSHDEIVKATEIQHWFRSEKRMTDLAIQAKNICDSIEFVIEIFRKIQSYKSFDELKRVLSQPELSRSLEAILQILPKDINLKSKNSIVRSSRFLITSLLISRFPGDLLCNDDLPDDSSEAVRCDVASKLLFARFFRLLLALKESKVCYLRRCLVGYRFAARYYLECFEDWGRMDSFRMKESLESSFMETYGLILSTKRLISKIDEQQEEEVVKEKNLLINLESEIKKIEMALEKVGKSIGLTNFLSRFEELKAYVEDQFQQIIEEEEENRNLLSPVENDFNVVQRISSYVGQRISQQESSHPEEFEMPNNLTTVLKNIMYFLSNMADSENLVNHVMEVNDLLYQLLIQERFTFGLKIRPESFPIEKYEWKETTTNPFLRDNTQENLSWKDIMSLVKGDIMSVIDGRMIANMKPSTLSIDEISPGCVVAVHNTTSRKVDAPIIEFSEGDYYQYGRILREYSIPSTEFSNESDVEADSSIRVVDILYSEQQKETGVRINRIKLSSYRSIASMFISTLKQLIDKIAMLTPHKREVQEKALFEQFDHQFNWKLIEQSVENHGFVVEEFLNICDFFFQQLSDLQAPFRLGAFSQWTKLYRDVLMQSSTQSKLAFFDYIPSFFKFCNVTIDIIIVDICNYYISMLMSMMNRSQVAQIVALNLAKQYVLFSQLDSMPSNSKPPSNAGNMIPNHGGDQDLNRTLEFLLRPMYQSTDRKELWSDFVDIFGLVNSQTSVNHEGGPEFFSHLLEYPIQILSTSSSSLSKNETSEGVAAAAAADSRPARNSFSETLQTLSPNMKFLVISSYIRVFFALIPFRFAQLRSSSASMTALSTANSTSSSSNSILVEMQRILPEITWIEIFRIQQLFMSTFDLSLLMSLVTSLRQIFHRYHVLVASIAPSLSVAPIRWQGAAQSHLQGFLERVLELMQASKKNLNDASLNNGENHDDRNIESSSSWNDAILAECFRFFHSVVSSSIGESTTAASSIIYQVWREVAVREVQTIAFSETSKVFHLFFQRISRLILRAGVGMPYQTKVPMLSLDSSFLQQRLQQLIDSSNRLFQDIYSCQHFIYSNIYTSPDFKDLLQHD